jgi:hypothetical protein
MQPGFSGDCADEADSLELTGRGQPSLLLAPIAQMAKPATINRTDKTRFTAIIRFMIIRRKAWDSVRILETAMGLASFFALHSTFFWGFGHSDQPHSMQSFDAEGRHCPKTTLGKGGRTP